MTRTIRLRTLMVATALVACALGGINEGIVRHARSRHITFHDARAKSFANQAAAYRGNQPGVRDQSREYADWHRKRAEAYRRSRKYDHEIEMKQDLAQTEVENRVDRLLTVDRDARRAAGR